MEYDVTVIEWTYLGLIVLVVFDVKEIFNREEQNIQIKKHIAKEKYAHVFYHQICIVNIGHKTKNDYNKNEVDEHDEVTTENL